MPEGLVHKAAREFHIFLRKYCLGNDNPQGYGQTWLLKKPGDIADILIRLAQRGQNVELEAPRLASMHGYMQFYPQDGNHILVGPLQDRFVVAPDVIAMHVNSNASKSYIALGYVRRYEPANGSMLDARAGEPLIIRAYESSRPREELLFEFTEDLYMQHAERIKDRFQKTICAITSMNQMGLRLNNPIYDLEREQPALGWRLFLPDKKELKSALKLIECKIWQQEEVELVYTSTHETGIGPAIDVGVIFRGLR